MVLLLPEGGAWTGQGARAIQPGDGRSSLKADTLSSSSLRAPVALIHQAGARGQW